MRPVDNSPPSFFILETTTRLCWPYLAAAFRSVTSIARTLDAPLDLVLVRKIGVPWQPELALGAVTDGGDPEVFTDHALVAELGIPEDYIKAETARQIAEIERRRRAYRAGREPLEIAGRVAIVVDDGIATGATMRVALQATRRRNPSWLVLATPGSLPDTLDRLRRGIDRQCLIRNS